MNHELPTPFLVFDFDNESDIHQRRVFSNPIQVISAYRVDEVEAALSEVQIAVQKGYYAAGFLSYEAAAAFDAAYRVSKEHQMPLLWFGIFSNPQDQIDVEWKSCYTVSKWRPETSKEEYTRSIKYIKERIAAGDTYQVNYTLRLRAHFEGDDLGYYHFLREVQEAKYSAYLHIGDFHILSVSPELFFRTSGRTIITRPMKGTMSRGRWLEEDLAHATSLAESQKNRAENVMVTDLLRNDLSRIAEVGTVKVPHLFAIEQYPTVHQMTSTVTAEMEQSTTLTDILHALFPSGSITGAPKINTMHIISELESQPREIYCGAIGLIEPNGNATFNVAIRTLYINCQTGACEYSVGGGITWDSTVEEEYLEALTKAALLEVKNIPFELLETLKLKNGEYTYLNKHITRLLESAQFFAIPLHIDNIIKQLSEHAQQFRHEPRRVRLLVARSGDARVESSHLQELPPTTQLITLATSAISKNQWFLYHKTTYRHMYEWQRSQHPTFFDVLLWNDHHEITEFTNGNIVLEIDGQKVTPARDCGLLAGTFRAVLLNEGVIQETVISLTDLHRVTQIWFINSVRGWVKVKLENKLNF